MTEAEARGVQVLKRRLDDALAQMPDGGRSFIDGLDPESVCDMADALSASGRVLGTGGNLLSDALTGFVRGMLK